MPPLNTFKRSSIAIALSHAIALPLQAATITVDSTSDTPTANVCSLRSAIIAANTNAPVDGCVAGDVSGSDTIDLTGLPNNSTITLNGNELPTVISTISLNGPGQDNLIISGNNNSRIVSVEEGGDLTVSSITLSNGSIPGRFNHGGAIQVVAGNLTINSSTLFNNSAGDDGGAIHARRESSMSLNNSTVSGNSASRGGGIYAGFRSNVNLSNSTVSGNSAGESGGGIYAGSRSNVNLSNSTVSSNFALSSNGGGIDVSSSSHITLSNSIIANSLGSGDCFDPFGNLTFDTASIIEDGSCGATALVGDIGLAPLANNGGPTQTHALLANSPARNAGIVSTCTTTDQRGKSRQEAFFVPIVAANKNIAVVDLGGDDACDIGAFEFSAGDE